MKYNLEHLTIKNLDIKLSLIISKYILENGDIHEYALLHKNMNKFQNLNLHDLDEFILKQYPHIRLGPYQLHIDLEASYADITDEKIVLDETSYLIPELSNLIFNHNKNLLIPESSKYLVEKKKIIEWLSYNTPIVNNPTITPLVGTSLGNEYPIPNLLYEDWIVTSTYLLSEYNIWKKALYYLENKNPDSISIEFKQAYNYFILRQFKMRQININPFDEKKRYILDFTLKDVIYRELCEDILYILLNLLLANKIIGNIALENSLNNKNNFLDILKDVIKDHYDENKEGYSCLKDLRWYNLNNYWTEYEINTTIKILSDN
uniref:hypothetical protein n=1 Tax=Dematophora necatrix TaxID=2751867 RepID=UPI0030E3CE27